MKKKWSTRIREVHQAKKWFLGVLGIILVGVIIGELGIKLPSSQQTASKEETMLEKDIKALSGDKLSPERVEKQIPKATKAQAKSLYTEAKRYFDEAQVRIQKGELFEILPGAYISADKSEYLSKGSPVAKEVLKGGGNQPAYVYDAGGGILLDSAGERVIMAKPAAEAVTKAAAAMARDGKKLVIGYCYRTLVRACILSAAKGDSRTTDPGESAHGAGLACDVANAKEAEPYLVEVGMLGGCSGTMYSSDFWHFSFGEMTKRDDWKIKICQSSDTVQRYGEGLGRLLDWL
jgi:LAS superfamily LD-carboxypeptidase LdcB